MYLCLYMYMCVYMYMCLYMFMYCMHVHVGKPYEYSLTPPPGETTTAWTRWATWGIPGQGRANTTRLWSVADVVVEQ